MSLRSHKGCRKLDRPARRRVVKPQNKGCRTSIGWCLVVRDHAKQTLAWIMVAGQISQDRLGGASQPILIRDVLLVSDKQSDLPLLFAGNGISHGTVNLNADVRVNGAVHVKRHGRLEQ